jgi:hypothetical protein
MHILGGVVINKIDFLGVVGGSRACSFTHFSAFGRLSQDHENIGFYNYTVNECLSSMQMFKIMPLT